MTFKKNSLHILNTGSFSDICFANNFSYSVTCHFLHSTFCGVEVLVFMKSNLSVILLVHAFDVVSIKLSSNPSHLFSPIS